ncbi:MAG: undecaprenyl-diphosphate phosphatase [Pseudomonadota bacterium]
MSILDIIALALIQGITEFLPISSSGHLVLWPLLTGRPDQGITMDVAVHLGTLLAVCLYFRAETGQLARGGVDIVARRWDSDDARLAILVAVATIPAVAAGVALKLSGAMDSLRSIAVIGWTTLIGGILLWLADRYGRENRAGDGWRMRDAVLMGLAQACALVPGTSRSGACMTMARALGFKRDEGATLALVMAIPVILAASLVELAGLIKDGNLVLGLELVAGAVLSFLSALAALAVMMRMFQTEWTMLPFVIYRLVLGVFLLVLAYS